MKQIKSIILGVVLLLLYSCTPERPEQRARQIIEATGCQGGLIVHVGCGNGRLTAALRLDDRYLVHGLALDEAELSQARDYVMGQKSYGIVSFDLLLGNRLPYIDNLLNLVVVEETGRVDMNEVMRVLAPGGVAYTKVGDTWEKTVKPRPGNIDDWTHFLHDSGGNAVAHDTVVGPPERLQWRAAPDYHRHHEHVGSIHTVISSGGRIFYIIDEGPIASILMPPKWFLVARDAFNGVELWKRPIKKWLSHLGTNRFDHSNSLHRNLVASEKHVYATIGDNNEVVAVDPATGEIVRAYESTEGAEEIIYSDGKLFVVITLSTGNKGSAQKRILALDTDTGKLLWKKTDHDTATLIPLTIAAHGGRIYFQNTEAVICLDAKSGREQWQYARNGKRSRVRGFSPTLVAFGDVVLSADSEEKKYEGEIVALSAETGKRLWSGDCAMGYYAPVDVFVADGLLWVGSKPFRGHGSISGIGHEPQPDFTEGWDLHTGEVKRRLDTSLVWTDRPHHPRCHRNKATERFILNGRHGVEYIPLRGEEPLIHDFIRGSCRYGVMPCNGLLYLPAHYCQCHSQTLLNGFTALAPASTDSGEQLFGEFGDIEKSVPGLLPSEGTGTASTDDHWPAYRHDLERSGTTKHGVPTDLKMKWQADLGGTLTSVVVSEGKLLVASPETHTVHALDAQTGKRVWHYTTGGRVDSPPTIHSGRALLGSADGRVYCLRVSDGKLLWQFRAAPRDLRTVIKEQLESLWPVQGSVLVKGPSTGSGQASVYFAAGRSSNLDGGVLIYQLDVNTGRMLSQKRLDSRQEGYSGPQQTKPDIMLADDHSVYMRKLRFSLQDVAAEPVGQESNRLRSVNGFLDGSFWFRGGWWFGPSRKLANTRSIGQKAPAAKIMSFDDESVYGYGLQSEYFAWTTPHEYRLFSADKEPEITPITYEKKMHPAQRIYGSPKSRFETRWSVEIPLHVRAMLLADKTLFIAGTPDVTDEGKPQLSVPKNPLSPEESQKSLDAWEGKLGAHMWAVDAKSGAKLKEYQLASPPVFDGMAAVQGRIYMSLLDGTVVCFGKDQ